MTSLPDQPAADGGAAATTPAVVMTIDEVMAFLPHRYPMLMIDRVLAFEPGKSLTALKNVTINEPFFPGHYPHKAIMPGVLILEIMAQATGILALRSMETRPDKDSMYYFAGIDSARFRRPVEPGDQLIVEVRLKRKVRGIWKVDGTASVDGAVAATAELMGALRDNPA